MCFRASQALIVLFHRCAMPQCIAVYTETQLTWIQPMAATAPAGMGFVGSTVPFHQFATEFVIAMGILLWAEMHQMVSACVTVRMGGPANPARSHRLTVLLSHLNQPLNQLLNHLLLNHLLNHLLKHPPKHLLNHRSTMGRPVLGLIARKTTPDR